MAVYGCNDEGVAALRKAAGSLEGLVEEIDQQSNSIESTAESNRETLGPHSETELKEAIENIKAVIAKAASPVEAVKENLYGLADDYQEIIDAGLGVGGSSGSSSGGN